MLGDYASSWKSQMRFAATRESARRTAQGGTMLGTQSETEMHQPQDGSMDPDARSRVAEISAHLNRSGLIEPEDARLTGTTRSLMRRLMGLNVISRSAQKAAAPLRGLIARKEPRVA
jgi:hypothetical protein